VSTKVPETSDASTETMDSTVMCAAYTQTETTMDGRGAAAKKEYQCELQKKIQKIRELEEELAASKRLVADMMLNINSVEQQVRKYAEKPVIRWSDDCDCKHQVSAVADLLKKFIMMESDAKKSKQEATSGKKNKVNCETQTEENSRPRDCANAQSLKMREMGNELLWYREQLPGIRMPTWHNE